MLLVKIIRSNRNTATHSLRTVIKFCYFLATLALISCGNKQGSKEQQLEHSSNEAENTPSNQAPDKTILCFGDSITAGYGLDNTDDAFPGLLQARVDSLGLEYQVVNSGVSGETSAGGRSRIDWVLRQRVDILILELGGNDGLRGIPLSETQANLQAIIDAVYKKYPEVKVILAGMEIPPNMGQEYTAQFRAVFSELAKENDVSFIPFILQNVGGIPELNQDDGIHPTAQGHRIVANTVWEALAPLLKS